MKKAHITVLKCSDYKVEKILCELRKTMDILYPEGLHFEKSAKILLKPNLLSPRSPEHAVTTHPLFVEAVVRLFQECGAGNIWIGDSSAGNYPQEKLWTETGMTLVAKRTGAVLKSFTEKTVRRQIAERMLPIPEWCNEVDFVVNLPKLKTHSLTLITCAMKNMFGLISGSAKAVQHVHNQSPLAISEFLVEMYSSLKPDLNLVDAIVAMEGDGPSSGTPRKTGLIIGGKDAVAVDSIASRLYGLKWHSVAMLRIASCRGIGIAESAKIDISGNGVDALFTTNMKKPKFRFLHNLPDIFFYWVFRLLNWHIECDFSKCSACGMCTDICPKNAIKSPEGENLQIDRNKCILCLCCVESCSCDALSLTSHYHKIKKIFR